MRTQSLIFKLVQPARVSGISTLGYYNFSAFYPIFKSCIQSEIFFKYEIHDQNKEFIITGLEKCPVRNIFFGFYPYQRSWGTG